jgi:SAM-dependent methyltransferase
MTAPDAIPFDLGPPSRLWTSADKLAALACRTAGIGPLCRTLLPEDLRGEIHARRVLSLGSRRYFADVLLPAVCRDHRRILSVGVDRYTRTYTDLARTLQAEFWTMDRNPDVARFADPDHHVHADFLALDAAAYEPFDALLFNGVFGYGIDAQPAMEQAIGVIAALLRPDGLLVLGWNRGLVPDPYSLQTLPTNFKTASLPEAPARATFAHGETHTYDLLRRR